MYCINKPGRIYIGSETAPTVSPAKTQQTTRAQDQAQAKKTAVKSSVFPWFKTQFCQTALS